jgi:spermidine/putrescine transport system ATP-binding protein
MTTTRAGAEQSGTGRTGAAAQSGAGQSVGQKSGAATDLGSGLEIRQLTKRYGTFIAVDGIDLAVPEGSFFALLGPSGCGKTTTLRMVAGLEDPTAGAIYISGSDVSRRRPYQRPVNTVFQNYALFPHLTVYENVAFGLKRRKVKDVRPQVMSMLELVEMEHLAQRKPTQLSGGQQQRIAVVRALVNRPKVLLLDEPLGALDLKLRRQMQLELKRIQTEVGITFIHVTHDQEEAMTMADTIAVMNAGHIEQLGAPVQLYENPSTVFVANFLGQSNLLRGTITGRTGDVVSLSTAAGDLTMPAARSTVSGTDCLVGVRPEKIQMTEGTVPPGHNQLSGTVLDASFIGVSTEYLVKVGGDTEMTVFSQNTGTAPLITGTSVTLHWDASHTFAMDGAEDLRAGLDDPEAE